MWYCSIHSALGIKVSDLSMCKDQQSPMFRQCWRFLMALAALIIWGSPLEAQEWSCELSSPLERERQEEEGADSVLESPGRRIGAIALSGGSDGLVGVDVNLRFHPKWNLRCGLRYFNLSIENYETNFNRFEYYANIDLRIRQSNLSLMAEYSPWNRGLKLVGGIGYFFWDNSLYGKGGLRDAVPLNDVMIPGEDIGYIAGEVTFGSPVNPYLGFGFGNAIPRKRFGISVDAGFFYKGKPRLDLTATNLIKGNEVNEDQLEENISPYRWWPVVSLTVAFKLNDT